VEDARELRERAPTAPAMGREKVYIIDEAQRLTAPAFDALLKLFEEPPPGVRFVLATTEPQKMPATIVGRTQRFDFRRFSLEMLAEQLKAIAASEGVELTDPAAHTIARAAEGSSRDAISILDQASVLGGRTVDESAVTTLLGAPRVEVQHELADAVGVGDARAAFELIDRLVQDGRDLRTVTSEALAHFRNLLIVKTAPGQADLLDVPSDAYELLRIQAEKFTPAEISRVIARLLDAQNDMRWTTSPRISLELALVHATLPDTDPRPAAIVSRLERLERLANLEPTSVMPETTTEPLADRAVTTTPVPEKAATKKATPKKTARSDPPAAAAPETPAADGPTTQLRTGHPHAADAGSIDVSMLRRSWPTLMDHLGGNRQAILRAILESATVAAYDGQTLELAFPPDRTFGPEKVEARQDELRVALKELFGIDPTIVCVVRESVESAPAVIDLVEEEDVPDDAEAMRRVKEMLGAPPSDGGSE
jgi:DNA polymerase III subunit gamma/tau